MLCRSATCSRNGIAALDQAHITRQNRGVDGGHAALDQAHITRQNRGVDGENRLTFPELSAINQRTVVMIVGGGT